jgi:hypothetical protein
MIWLLLDKIPFTVTVDIFLVTDFMFVTFLTMFPGVLVLLAEWAKTPL